MNGYYQFSLRHLFPATTLLAICLGVGKWCYIKCDDRIRPVTTEADLQFCMGKRVSLFGRYQHIGSGSALRVIWFGKHQTPIALVGECTNGSALSQIPDGASITVTGRLTHPPTGITFPVPIERGGRRDDISIYHETDVQPVDVCCYSIDAEEMSVAPPSIEGEGAPIRWL
jgi:hypothetical protein